MKYFLQVMFVNFWCWNRTEQKQWSDMGFVQVVSRIFVLGYLNFGARHCCHYLWAWSSSGPSAFGNNFTFVVTVQCKYLSSDSDSSKKLHINRLSSENFPSKLVEVIQLHWRPQLNHSLMCSKATFWKGPCFQWTSNQPQHSYEKLGFRSACSGPCL